MLRKRPHFECPQAAQCAGQSGFSLIELMVAVALIGIAAALAGPSFVNLMKNSQIDAASQEFVTALNITRSEAVKQGVTVKMQALVANGANEWGGGWQIWADTDNNNAVNGAEILINQHAALRSGTIDSLGNISTVSFLATGYSDLAVAGSVFHVSNTGATGNACRNITSNRTGRVSVAKVTCP